VSGGHAHEIDPGAPLDGPIERLAPEAKVVGAVAFLVAAVATPAGARWAWALDAAMAGALAVAALVPARVLARRLLFEVPFAALAVALALAGTDPRVTVLGVPLSEPGLRAAWTILSRATLGVAAASVLAATTTPAELLVALARLRVPVLLRTLAELAVRYLAVLRAELDRLRLAQELRSPDRRRLRPAEVAGVGAALFVRAYERGERVHLARAARRGGSAPAAVAPLSPVRSSAATGPARSWILALAPALVATGGAVASRLGV
jgi:cobalt/nickel transport system permease protein